jgi:predicted DNA-binding transcriptional regulator AlpA
MMKRGKKMLTVKQVSELTGASPSSIRVWLSNEDERKKRFPGAVKEESPIGSYWLIPESDVKGYENPGRGRPKAKGRK